MVKGAVVCFGEMLLRYSPQQGGSSLAKSAAFTVHVAGAEANVAISLASLGMPTRMATVLPDNPLADKVRSTLIEHGVDTRYCVTGAGRLGAYYVEDPVGGREGGFFYDRSGSAFAGARNDAIAWPEALADASCLHLSGISAALGDGPLAMMHEAIEEAQERGIPVSFDCNYRPVLWEGRESQAQQVLRELACRADLVFASPWDEDFLTGGSGSDDGLFAMSERVQLVASTDRHELGEAIELGATVRTRSQRHRIDPVPITTNRERVGAGDAFAAGLIFGWLRQWPIDNYARFAHRACLLKHAIRGDFSTLTMEQVLAPG